MPDLSQYVVVGRYDLPEPTRTTAPANSVLAQEVSAVTYNWDTDTLFVVGDGGTSVVQVSKTGALINSMTLAQGSSPQGTAFYDPEGITYIGGGKFVMTEERDRNAVQFTYAADTTLTRDAAQIAHLGTFSPNIGLEGLSWDPQTGGFIFVKEKTPEGVFQTTIDFATDTASNGSATTVNSTNLFDPALLGVNDLADVFALSNIPGYVGTSEAGNLLLLSQESAKILEVDRSGHILSTLDIVSNPGNPLDVVAQQHEGLTMDRDGNIYVVSENGGGDFDHPQLWVYAPSAIANAAPSAISLTGIVSSIDENTVTAARVKVADIVVTDDGLGTNIFSVSGADASFFEADSTGLYIKAGVVLDYETKASYSVTVNVDDASVHATPDASTPYTLTINNLVNENVLPAVTISEVAPWSSGNSPVGADWFEVTNNGSSALSIAGWKVDDSSFSFGAAAALNGITSIAPGESVIFIETANPSAATAAFIQTWFGGSAPAGLQIGSYTGSGIGLSTGGDGVALFDAAGNLQAEVSFGSSPAGPTYTTFNNAAGLTNATISTLSVIGVNGAFAAANDANEIGSPGSVGRLIISEVAPWSSGNSPVGADWFEVTNTSAAAVDVSGWKMDDSSGSFAAAAVMSGIASIAAGESVIFLETNDLAAARAAFINTWFGGIAPAGLQFGAYSGGGVGLSNGGDAVNLYDTTGALRVSVAFGASGSSAPYVTFDNTAGLDGVGTTITAMSAVGSHGAFTALTDLNEIGSPGRIVSAGEVAGPDTLVFQHGAGGSVAVWDTTGGIVSGGDLPDAPGGSWTAIASGDLTGAGGTDVLFADASGTIGAWRTDGTAILGGGAIGHPGAGWTFAALGDFDGDGKDDILFHDAVSGNYATWEMAGSMITGGGTIGAAPGFALVATGDLDGDGKTDMVFEDSVTGDLRTWLLDGTQIVGGGLIGNAGSGWHIIDTGDFNGDGKADLLFEGTSGQLAIWDMNGINITGGNVIGTPGGAFEFVKVLDVNQDGKDDIVFADATGAHVAWLMDNIAIVGGSALGFAPAGYNLV